MRSEADGSAGGCQMLPERKNSIRLIKLSVRKQLSLHLNLIYSRGCGIFNAILNGGKKEKKNTY